MNSEIIDFSDDIRALQDIRGSLHILLKAGEHANDYNELYSYQMLTGDAFPRHIKELEQCVERLKKLDNSKNND